MTTTPPSESPLTSITDAVGSYTTETFSILSNETRLAILLALWDEYDPYDTRKITYTELTERVEIEDKEQFDYHLSKLEGKFIQQTEDGYELKNAGIFFVQSTITGTGIEEPKMDPTRTDYECQFCGSQTEFRYDDGKLYNVCTSCTGADTDRDDEPSGIISSAAVTPVALFDRSPLEIAAVSAFSGLHQLRSFVEGICPVCNGPVEAWLEACTDHDSDELCTNCGSQQAFWGNYRCRVCKAHHIAAPARVVSFHPAAISFFYEHGHPYMWQLTDVMSFQDIWTPPADRTTELVSTDPTLVRVEFQIQDDRIQFMLDENLHIADVCWRACPAAT